MNYSFCTRRFICAVTALFAAFSLTGCGMGDVESFFTDVEEMDKAAKEDPKFWYDAAPVSGSENLSIISNDLFYSKPYNNMYRFGEDILFVGDAYYGTPEEMAEYGSTDEIPFEYSFEVYSPWQNIVLYELPHDKIFCSYYQVIGDYLYLFDEVSHTISIYDHALKLTGQYDCAYFFEHYSGDLYPTEQDLTVYAYNESSHTFDSLTFGDGLSFSDGFTLPVYAPSYQGASSTGNVCALTYVDAANFDYRQMVLDTSSCSIVSAFDGDSFFAGDVNDHAFVGRTSYYEDYWVYDTADSAPSFFMYPNGTDALLLSDDSFILVQEDYDYSVSNYPVTFSHILGDGSIGASFTYDCGDRNSSGSTYLSLNQVVFEDMGLCFILAYSPAGAPQLLVWNYVGFSDSPAQIPFYSSEKEIRKTLVASDASKLQEVRSAADELEEKYGVTIFLGDEISESIDFFLAEQQLSSPIIFSALEELDRILSFLPAGFLDQLCYGMNHDMEIYLTGDLTGTKDEQIAHPAGFVSEVDSHIIMVLDTNCRFEWDHIIAHELSHAIDRRLAFRSSYVEDALFSEETWNSFNPEDFQYPNSYNEISQNWSEDWEGVYFLNSYSATYATEDRAEIFGNAVDSYQNGWPGDLRFTGDNPLNRKYEYYCDCIRDGFDTTGWKSVMPWEELRYNENRD